MYGQVAAVALRWRRMHFEVAALPLWVPNLARTRIACRIHVNVALYK